MVREVPTTTGALARLGFTRTDRVKRFLAEPALAELGENAPGVIGAVPDGDEAVLSLLRVAEAARDKGQGRLLSRFLGAVGTGEGPGDALIAVLGTSMALGDFLARHPEALAHLDTEDPSSALSTPAEEVRERMLRAVGADPSAAMPVADLEPRPARDALRVAYHERLLQIAAADVTAEDPIAIQPQVSACLSDLADSALDVACAIARSGVEGHEQVRWSVLAMGKTGARELNYISDVDVMHVVGPAEGQDVSEDTLVHLGSRMAREMARACADRTPEGALWQVDANLRPEGKIGRAHV